MDRHAELKKWFLAYSKKLGKRDLKKYNEPSTDKLEKYVQELLDEYHHNIGQHVNKKRVDIKKVLRDVEHIQHQLQFIRSQA